MFYPTLKAKLLSQVQKLIKIVNSKKFKTIILSISTKSYSYKEPIESILQEKQKIFKKVV
jgi:hypothetical protein